MAYNSAYTGAQVDAAVGAVRNKETTWDSKQNALSGTEDQLVGFNASGEAAAVPMPSAVDVGADPAGTAEEEISEHNASSSAHATLFSEKQDKITGQQGQIVGFDSSGNPIAQTAPDTGVVTFNGRSGAVTPQTGDYTADMVGARPNTWTPTASEVGAIPATEKGAASGVATLGTDGKLTAAQKPAYTASEVGARPSTWTPSAEDVGARPDDWTPSAAEVGADPTGTAAAAVAAHNQAESVHTAEFAKKADAAALTAHTGNTSNPHNVTAEQAGARPDTWTPTAQEVGADPAGTAESAVSAHNQASDAHSTQFNAKANASDLTAHTGNKNNPHGVTAAQVGAAKPGDVFTVTLLASGWSEKSQTVNDERFVTSGYAFITNPADASFTAWAEAVIHGQDVTVAGQMTFTCAGDAPTGDITVKIIRLEATEA